MKQSLFRNIFFLVIIAVMYAGCSKGYEGGGTSVNPPPPPPPPPAPQNCYLNVITQNNSGVKPEFALNIAYDANLRPTRVLVYDSAANKKLYDAAFNYVTPDSVRIDNYQYLKLDASKRVIVFVTKENMASPTTSDDYRYTYSYNSIGYLVSKSLFINNDPTASYTTTYSYTNGLLTGCQMVLSNAGNLKLFESTLVYDTKTDAKNWIYTFPDAFESMHLSTAFSFGNKPGKALSQVISKVYNPANNTVIDTWTTHYSGYSLNSNGYLAKGVTSGDQQQGMIGFYGQTNFAYQCQ